MDAPVVPAVFALETPRLDASTLDSIRCQGCDAALDWSQPDPRKPAKLLGVCGRCGDWHVLDLDRRARAATCLHIPNRRRAPSLPAIPSPLDVGVVMAVPSLA